MPRSKVLQQPPPITDNAAALARQAELARRCRVVDEAGDLCEQIEPLKRLEVQLEALKKDIASWADTEFKPAEAVTFEGERHSAQVGKKGDRRRVVSMKAVYKVLGLTKFLAICSCTLKALESEEANLTPKELSALVVKDENVADRLVKFFRRAIPANKAA